MLWMYTSPRSVFARIEDTGAYGWALAVMLALVIMMGYLLVQSGLIDRVIDKQTEERLADLESSQTDLVDRIALREDMEDQRKLGAFGKTIARLQVVVVYPIYLVASFLLISAVLYAIVALTGRKPEWHTLMSICVYAGFIELVGYAIQVGMVFYYRSLKVDTSLRMLAEEAERSFLGAVDPFRIWFWVLVGMGLAVTHQLSRRMAIVSCMLMCLITMGVRAAMEMVPTG